MSILSVTDAAPYWMKKLLDAGAHVAKAAADAEVAYNLAGTLYLDKSSWILLTVPNAFVRSIYGSMTEPGIELPPDDQGRGLIAHISVMRPEEIESIGGADKITERGKQYKYTIGRLYSVEPDDWPGVSKVWFVKVHSPDLQELRRSYGLSSLPNSGKYDFHISVAIRRKGVLGRNETRKAD